MTREEAIAYFKDMNECTYGDVEPIQMAIKALEQEPCVVNIKDSSDDEIKKFEEIMKKATVQVIPKEPCDDAISREDAIKQCGFGMTSLHIADNLRKLPPVQPKPKTGHWIEGQTDNPNIHNILCSCCFEGYPSKGHANSQYTREKFQWCPKCGARMIESQESEDKE